MARYPEIMTVQAQLRAADLRDGAALARRTWEAAGLPALARWGIGAGGGSASEEPPADAVGPGGLGFELADGGVGVIVPAEVEGLYTIRLPVEVGADPPSRVPAVTAATRRWWERLRPAVTWATLLRGIGAGWLPNPPFVPPDAVLLLISQRHLQDGYVSVTEMRAAWASSVEQDDVLVMGRGEDALDTVAWAEVAEPSQWALARAARAGRTVYRPATPLPEEEPIYFAGAATLTPTAYADGVLTYAAWTPPGTHVRGWEVLGLLALLTAGRAADGQPLHELQVTFVDEAAAVREARPLLDIGVRVRFAAPDGTVQHYTG